MFEKLKLAYIEILADYNTELLKPVIASGKTLHEQLETLKKIDSERNAHEQLEALKKIDPEQLKAEQLEALKKLEKINQNSLLIMSIIQKRDVGELKDLVMELQVTWPRCHETFWELYKEELKESTDLEMSLYKSEVLNRESRYFYKLKMEARGKLPEEEQASPIELTAKWPLNSPKFTCSDGSGSSGSDADAESAAMGAEVVAAMGAEVVDVHLGFSSPTLLKP